MKLKTLSKIEMTANVIITLIMIPFFFVNVIIYALNQPFNFAIDKLADVRHWFGNFLLRKSDEVKNGVIKNQMCIRQYTARLALKELKRKVDLK